MLRRLKIFGISTVLASGVFLNACASQSFRDVETIQPGMDKDYVLSVAGPPTITRRRGSTDHWVYVRRIRTGEKAGQGNDIREVHFRDGKATYIGGEYHPEISAQEQDRRNEESNRLAEMREAELNAQRDDELGIMRPGAKSGRPSVRRDPIDQRLRDSLYGNPTPADERNKIAPTFETIR